MRADLAVGAALKISRNKASELIKSGLVSVNFTKITKPSDNIINIDNIEVKEQIYVGRGAIKLNGFLGQIKPSIDFTGMEALDIGSSTGGFVQVLLQYGVKSVVALDVGSNQLSQILRQNPKVKVRENTDIRNFESDKFDLITVDVSFISVLQILEHIDRLAKGEIIILFKPQFEVGKLAKRNAKGVVKDTEKIKHSFLRFELKAMELGWKLLTKKQCVITGKEGNNEFFYLYTKR